MAWAKSKDFLERLQLGSIVLYLICLGGYTIDRVGVIWDHFRADLFGFAFFSLFIASTILLRFEEGGADDDEGSAPNEGNAATT